jgi:hypothetical protein
MAAKGILKTADTVANMLTKAISLEPAATDSNLKKKANITRAASRMLTRPQLTRVASQGSKAEEMAKPIPAMNSRSRIM